MGERGKDRWQRAVSAANNLTLPGRWQTLTQEWAAAMTEYRALYHAGTPDVARLRQVRRRVHDLAQRCQVMGHAIAP